MIDRQALIPATLSPPAKKVRGGALVVAADLRFMVDTNYAAHKHPNVKTRPAKNPRVTIHFTPTHPS